MSNEWVATLDALKTGLSVAQNARVDLERWETETVAAFERYARQPGGPELDLDAIKQMLLRPYTLIPINEHEAWLIQSRAVKMPMVGWLVAQDGAFNKFKVSRSMDLLTPLPTWMKNELGWKPSEFAAQIDGTRTAVLLTQGDETAFKRKYGSHLGQRQADGTYKIRGGDAWIKLVAALVRDGILPYAAQPVADKHWDDDAPINPKLLAILEKLEWQNKRPFIQRAVDEFHAKGAVLVNYPPGAGKTLIASLVLNRFVGKTLILADTTILVEQWHDRIKQFAPNADATISTYQGAQKYLDREWDLIIPDEAQRLPANTFSRLAFVKTKYRLGLTGTPWREDDRQHLIVALSGFPVAVRWSELVAAGVLKRPRIIVATVPSDNAKTAYVKRLLAQRKGGRAIIFCDWIDQGQKLADDIDVPFVHGGTARKFERVLESEVCVVSRIGDRGLDLPDLRLVIEVAGAGSAREQFAQRVGRLLHGSFAGEFYTVFTPEEAAKYRPRVFGVEAELAGEVDIEFISVGDVSEPTSKTVHQRPTRVRETASTMIKSLAQSEFDQVVRNPAVAKLIARAYVGTSNQVQQERKIHAVLRLGWDSAISLEILAAGKGLSSSAQTNYKAAFLAAEKAGLMAKVDDGWITNKGKLLNVVKLNQRLK